MAGAIHAAVVALALACLAPHPARAAEADSSAAPTLMHPSMGVAPRAPSPGVAALLSHGALVLPIVLSTQVRAERRRREADLQILTVGTGVVFGPALGYWYGGVAPAGTRGMAGRLLVGAVGYSALLALRGSDDEFQFGDVGLGVVALGAAGVTGVWALWDAATVAPRVEAANRSRRAVSWNVGTVAAPASGAPAVAIVLRF